MKIADQVINSDRGKKSYSYRGNKCESPHGFIKHNLNGKKLKMIGLKRNHTVVILYSMLYNFRRLISVKLNDDKNSDQGVFRQPPINNSEICINEAEKRCLRYNIIHKDEPLGFQDKLLRRLEDLVMDILRIELKKETGEFFKINEYVNKIME